MRTPAATACRSCSGSAPSPSTSIGDELSPSRLEQVEQRREGRVFDGDPVTESHQMTAEQIEGVHRTVGDGQGLGWERPVGPQ